MSANTSNLVATGAPAGALEPSARPPFAAKDHYNVAVLGAGAIGLEIKLRSGRTVLLEASWAAHQPEPDFNGTQLFGTDAGLLLPPLRLFHRGLRGYASELVVTGTSLVHPNRMVHFIDVLLGKAEPYVRVEESFAVQRILDAIYQSAATGREVRIDSAPTG